jgi:hypothetical protein
LESLTKEQHEKGILYEELMAQIEEKKRILIELQDEVDRHEQLAQSLDQTLQNKRSEGEELDELLADRDNIIRQLESQLEEFNRNRPPPTPEPQSKPIEVVNTVIKEEPLTKKYVADSSDEVDKLLAQYVNFNTCPVPIKRLGGGYYLFGTRKIYAKVMNGRLVIRVGGGYMIIDEFISTYAEVEVSKMRAREAKGLDAVPDIGSPGSAKGKASPKSGKKSPNSKTMARKSSGSRSPKQEVKVYESADSNRLNGTFRSRKLNQNKFDRLRSSQN